MDHGHEARGRGVSHAESRHERESRAIAMVDVLAEELASLRRLKTERQEQVEN